MNYEDAITRYCNEQIAITGTTSAARNQHIKTALTFLHNLKPELDWEFMSTSEAKELYGKLVQSDLADSTRAIRSRYVLNFYKYLAEEKINTNLDMNVLNKMKAHKNPPPIIDEQEILTEDQLQNLLNQNMPEEMKTVIACLFGGGMRVSEVLNLRPADVTFKFDEEFGRSYFRISVDDRKTQKRRTTFIVIPYLMDVIKNHMRLVKNTDEYFIMDNEQQLKYSYVRYWFDKYKCLYPKLSSHKGRKFNISHRIANGESASTVCLTTHGAPTSPSINHYLRLNEKDAIRGIMRNNT